MAAEIPGFIGILFNLEQPYGIVDEKEKLNEQEINALFSKHVATILITFPSMNCQQFIFTIERKNLNSATVAKIFQALRTMMDAKADLQQMELVTEEMIDESNAPLDEQNESGKAYWEKGAKTAQRNEARARQMFTNVCQETGALLFFA